LEQVAQMGIAPKAMLFSESIDSLAAAGLILAEIWVGKRICTVDRLGREFLECVKDGQRIEVCADGTVIVHEAEAGQL
jgi:predicted aconitase with swiveling domain